MSSRLFPSHRIVQEIELGRDDLEVTGTTVNNSVLSDSQEGQGVGAKLYSKYRGKIAVSQGPLPGNAKGSILII